MKLSDEQLKEFANQIKRDDFAEQLNTTFRVDQNFDAKLIEVSEVKGTSHQESFSMLFLLPENFPLAQGTYNLEHPQIGTHDISLVPIEHVSDGYIFEAVFTRFLPKN